MISAADLRAWLSAETTDDALLAELELAAVAFLQQQTNRYFGPVASTTEYLTGPGHARLWLAETPASLPATIKEYEYVGATATTITATAVDGYILRDSRLVRKYGYDWTAGYEYEVSYSRGYAAGTEPSDIRQLVIDLVGIKWSQRGSEGLSSETVGPYSYNYSSSDVEAVPGAAATLATWRRWGVE